MEAWVVNLARKLLAHWLNEDEEKGRVQHTDEAIERASKSVDKYSDLANLYKKSAVIIATTAKGK